VFAQTLLVHMPRLPMIDEEQFGDATLRAAFMNGVERHCNSRHDIT
jgi:hypothetical protein